MTRDDVIAADTGEPAETTPTRSRRSLLAAGLGAAGILVGRALGRPERAEAATNVVLGALNTSATTTAIKTSPGGSKTAFLGQTRHNAGSGVIGKSPNSIGSALQAVGVRGNGTIGVVGNGEYMGVQGRSPNYGIFGYTTPDTGGLGGYGRGLIGLKGRSYHGMAVLGDTDDGTGVKGESYSAGGAVKAIYGEGIGANNNAVVGVANNGQSAYAVWGQSTSGYAGVFSGNALVTGTLSKGAGSFRIDHPLDPEHKYLSHSFVESPDMMNVYNGNVVTDARGLAVIRMPDYFAALNRDFRYQLTVIGKLAHAVVAKEIETDRFTIRSSEPHTKVSWQVTGIRKDPFANENRIQVVEDKPDHERGTYLHPSAYGKADSRSFQHEKLAALGASQPRMKRDAELELMTD